jgi:hypothetical protein
LEFLSAFKGKEPQKGFSMLPKRNCDVMESEVMRGVRMTAKDVSYVKFKVPRKTGGFSKELFPNWVVGTAAHDFASYWGGADMEPVREEVVPEGAKAAGKKANFMTKLTGKEETKAAPAPVAAGANNGAEVQELKAQLGAKDKEIEELKAQLEAAKSEIEDAK